MDIEFGIYGSRVTNKSAAPLTQEGMATPEGDFCQALIPAATLQSHKGNHKQAVGGYSSVYSILNNYKQQPKQPAHGNEDE